MSDTFQIILQLIRDGKYRISDHGYTELASDGLLAGEVVTAIENSIIVEDYPSYAKGPCVLLLGKNAAGLPIHALWGIPSGKTEPAVLITAYRPDPARWDAAFLRRR